MRPLHEFYNFMALSKMPEQVELKPNDTNTIKKLKWDKIKMEDPDATDAGSSAVFDMKFDFGKLNHILPGIVFKIEQDYRTELNQPHIQLTDDLQGLGLATKLYRLTLQEFGHVVSKKSKRLSDKMITGLYKKLAKDSKIDFFDVNGNYLLLHKDNPQYDELLNRFNLISK